MDCRYDYPSLSHLYSHSWILPRLNLTSFGRSEGVGRGALSAGPTNNSGLRDHSVSCEIVSDSTDPHRHFATPPVLSSINDYVRLRLWPSLYLERIGVQDGHFIFTIISRVFAYLPRRNILRSSQRLCHVGLTSRLTQSSLLG